MTSQATEQAWTLPCIDMYAGDTTPWKISLMREDGTPYHKNETSGYTCKMTITPFTVYAGIGNNAVAQPPIVTKTGTIQEGEGGAAYALITLSSSDTLTLRGRYTYQVEVTSGSDKRICQGQMVIRGNISR